MSNKRAARNLVLFGLLIIWCFLPTPIYSAQQTPSSTTIIKPVKPPSELQQVPFFIRGIVMTNYGKGVQGIEVSLLQAPRHGSTIPVDKKNTDSAGRYAFMVSPVNKGKGYKIVPKLPNPTCPGIVFEPVDHALTLQNSINAADFKLHLPNPPDTSISLIHATPGQYVITMIPPNFSFQLMNKGCLPTTKTSVVLNYTGKNGDLCTKEQAVDPIPAMGSNQFQISGCQIAANGSSFTATLKPQAGEVATQNNTVTSIIPSNN
jgi:hypothetical protein